MTNMNDWATQITLKEGKKSNLSIAQVKEVMKLMLHDLKEMPLKDLMALLSRIR